MNVIARNLLSRLAGPVFACLVAAFPAGAFAASTPVYPSLTAIPLMPKDLRTDASWAKAVADLNRAGAAVRRDAARPSGESATQSFESGARARLESSAIRAPSAEDQAASIAFSKALRARASAPPRRR